MLNRAASGAKYAYFFIDSNLCRQPHATHLTSRKHGVATPIFNRRSYSRHGGSERRSRCFRFFHGKISYYFSFKQLFRAKKHPPPIFLQIVDLQYIVNMFWRFDFFFFWFGGSRWVVLKKYNFILNLCGLRFLHPLLRFFTKLLSKNFLIFVW